MKVLINPAGGLIYNEQVKQWVYQRPVFNNIYIDSFSIDIAIPLADVLKTVGMKVFSTRLLNKVPKAFNNKWEHAVGESQQPRYRECCIQYLKTISTYENEREKKYIPAEVYSEGKTILEQDANARVNYARFLEVDMMVTLDATTLVTDNGMEVICNKAGERLANNVLDEVAKRTRAHVKGVSYMEEPEDLRYNSLQCPAIILKAGSTADGRTSNLMIQGWWRQWVSLGIFAGIWRTIK